MLLDFRTTMVTDGNADRAEEEHAATLIAFCSKFVDIASSEELMARLATGKRTRSPPSPRLPTGLA
jgi:isochorismate hydrolase